MSNLRLYPSVKVVGQDFSKVKSVTVPNQSMSIAEIIRRFTRKESLPIEHEGFYEDRMGDLEKLSREDITVKRERAAHIKSVISEAKRRKADSEKQPESASVGAPPKGDVTGSPVVAQAPAASPPA